MIRRKRIAPGFATTPTRHHADKTTLMFIDRRPARQPLPELEDIRATILDRSYNFSALLHSLPRMVSLATWGRCRGFSYA